jgi:hypothetical protein
VAIGGSQNHLLLIDTKSVSHNGRALSGDMAARILDVAGIVVNRNTIPGDRGAFNPTGVRLGTVWISQLGFGDAEVDLLAEAMAALLKGCTPYTYSAPGGKALLRAKVDPAALARAREIVRQLRRLPPPRPAGHLVAVRGAEATPFLDQALTSDVLGCKMGNRSRRACTARKWTPRPYSTACRPTSFTCASGTRRWRRKRPSGCATSPTATSSLTTSTPSSPAPSSCKTRPTPSPTRCACWATWC